MPRCTFASQRVIQGNPFPPPPHKRQELIFGLQAWWLYPLSNLTSPKSTQMHKVKNI